MKRRKDFYKNMI